MINELLQEKIQQFILEHEKQDVQKLLLKYREIEGVSFTRIADQITGRRKAKDKLPTFYLESNIIYPLSINLEQCSSDATARFKAETLRDLIPGETQNAVDLTGGFGVDSFFLSKIVKNLNYVDPNKDLLNIANHNHRQLKSNNILYHNTTAEEFLQNADQYFDFVFIDPSRRVESKKVFSLKDSVPDITILQPKIFERTENLLIKVSPMFDIKLGISELKNVHSVIVLSVDNEVKELLFFCRKGHQEEPTVTCVDLLNNQQVRYSFLFSEEIKESVEYSEPKQFLFEPNASVLKAGAFKSIAASFQLQKIAESTHIYTADSVINDFPGRVFRIIKTVSPEKKSLQKEVSDLKANVITRNYPLTTNALKAKTGLIDGGDLYYLAFSGKKKKFHLLCERVS